jgi:hypothetical protein
LLPVLGAYEALKHHVPTVGVCAVGSVKVELSPVVVAVVVESMLGPPVQGVGGADSWHSVHATVPVGAPPAELPITVAVSPQALPTEMSAGGRIVVVKPGVAAVTVKHSWLEGAPVVLSLEPV